MRSLITELREGSRREDARAVREDILRNVEALCRTRRGTVLVAPAFGMVDVLSLFRSSDQGAEVARRSLEEAIRRFEPRLLEARVRHLPSEEGDLTLRFEIVGAIGLGDQRVPVRFETSYDAAAAAVVR